MRVTMIGAGYVGLVSGACLADFGHQVTVIDKDSKRVAALNDGEIPIFEPGLDDIVDANFRGGRLEFSVETKRAADADAVFIAVGTPSRRGDGHADLSFVYDAVRQIAPDSLRHGDRGHEIDGSSRHRRRLSLIINQRLRRQ
jgi:UDPglucose 6-dehydrogenase